MPHTLYLRAINSPSAKVLQRLAREWPEFEKELLNREPVQQVAFLKAFLFDNEVIEPVKHNVPLLFTPNEDIQIMLSLLKDEARYFASILEHLKKLNALHLYSYYRSEGAEPLTVLVWTEDLPKLSRVIQKKLKKIR